MAFRLRLSAVHAACTVVKADTENPRSFWPGEPEKKRNAGKPCIVVKQEGEPHQTKSWTGDLQTPNIHLPDGHLKHTNTKQTQSSLLKGKRPEQSKKLRICNRVCSPSPAKKMTH